jgi:L-threonylcarbamoyladenylate synthase
MSVISVSGAERPLGRDGHRVRSRSIKAGDCTILRVTDLKRYDLRAAGLTRDQERAVSARFQDGDLVIYPTDTLYAIGCRAFDGGAVARLREAKGREADKALPVIVADLAQARSLAARWPEEAQRLAEAFWPGPLTLVVRAAASLPTELLAGAGTIAVRVPASEVARALARLAGPLVSTSANIAGETPCVTVDLAAAAFPAATLAFDVGPLDGAPSTIVDLTGPAGGFRILRAGRIDSQAIEQRLGSPPQARS